MEDTLSYFVFIITSRDNPLYEKFDSIRRTQMREQGVHYKFLLNGTLPEGYILQDDEEYYIDQPNKNGMYRKFVEACSRLNSTYDFIIRVNSSTFVNFTKVPEFLRNMTKKDHICCGWPLQYDSDKSKIFIAGTAMIFSKDCMQYLIQHKEDSRIDTSPDDVALSEISLDYCGYFTLVNIESFSHLWHNSLDYNRLIKENSLFFRVKNPDRETYDLRIWEDLYNMFS